MITGNLLLVFLLFVQCTLNQNSTWKFKIQVSKSKLAHVTVNISILTYLRS